MPTLLIIDDDAGLRDALAETAADQGYRVLQADGGEAGLQRLAQEPVDAVLLDLRMPGLDGLEVLARIRALPEPPAVTVLTGALAAVRAFWARVSAPGRWAAAGAVRPTA